MPKKKKHELSAVIRGGLDKGVPYTHMNDQVNFGQRIETKGVAHKTVKNIPIKNHEGSSLTIGNSEYAVRKKK